MATKMNVITGVAALALVFGAGPAFAQYGGKNGGSTGNTTHEPQSRQSGATTDESNSDKTTSNTKSSADESFAKKAAQGGMAEVKLGQLAQEKGTSPEVKNFGRQMVRDHSKANDELKSAASKDGISLPDQMDKSDQATYDHLSKLSGDAFDRQYARDMVKDHTKDVSEFQKEAKNGKNESIKNFAAQTVPTLQSHLDRAHQMDQAVNRSTSNGNTSNGNTSNGSNSGNGYPTNNRTNPGSSGTQSPSR